jgi:hypothetical protein
MASLGDENSPKIKVHNFGLAMHEQMRRHLPNYIQIEKNRDRYLMELRSGKYKKGCVKSDEKGNPIIETSEDAEGSCACAIMCHLFSPNENTSTTKARAALGITGKDCTYIQQVLNDSPLTFEEIADRIEKEIFKR